MAAWACLQNQKQTGFLVLDVVLLLLLLLAAACCCLLLLAAAAPTNLQSMTTLKLSRQASHLHFAAL